MIKQLTIIGIGLIGGSLARAVRQVEACQEIVGCGRHREHLQQALDLGVIDRFETDVRTAVQGADMVVIAVPLGAMEGIFSAIADHLAADAVVTDVGSAKGSVVDIARKTLAGRFDCFVPGHPIAGTEQSGVAASFSGLFEDRYVILTPLPETSPVALQKVRSLWSHTGAAVIETDVERHDRLLAATSHLPHLLAYTLVDTLAGLDETGDIFRYAAGGFRDFTRIASSNPVMWRDICQANREAILDVLDCFGRHLETLSKAIRENDSGRTVEIFARAKEVRDKRVKSKE